MGPGKVSAHLEVYGNLEKNLLKLWEKIRDKLRQVGDKNSVIAIWNDDECIDELASRFAVKHLNDEKIEMVIKFQIIYYLLFMALIG